MAPKFEWLMGCLACGCIRSLSFKEAGGVEAACFGRYADDKKQVLQPLLWTSLRHYAGRRPRIRAHRCNDQAPVTDPHTVATDAAGNPLSLYDMVLTLGTEVERRIVGTEERAFSRERQNYLRLEGYKWLVLPACVIRVEKEAKPA